MEKVSLFLTALALASPAFGQSAPTNANSTDAVRAEVAEIMAATGVRAASPLVPTAEDPLSIEDEVFLASFVARIGIPEYDYEPFDPNYFGPSRRPGRGKLGSLEPIKESPYLRALLTPKRAAELENLSVSREGLGLSIGQTRLSVHAAFLHGATGDPNSAAPLPVAVDGMDLTPAASAHRQFVFTLQAEIVF